MTDLVAHLAALTGAETDQLLWQGHCAAMRSYGFDHLLYGCTRYRNRASLGDPLDWTVLTTYPDGFMRDYVGLGHIHHAPMIHWALNHPGEHISWQTIRDRVARDAMSPREMEVLAFNQRFGITAGVTISFHTTSDRTAAAIALVGGPDRTQAEVDAIWNVHQTELLILNNVMHLKLMTLPQSGCRPLTQRQLEVLQWAGDGKTTQDIATLLGLTVATVEKHLRLARSALGVETTAQAVLKAAFTNQMFVGTAEADVKVRKT
ncbi:LuxR family transcriptional regulator [Loktanella atrilutea]|uniref:LuxR family transcriptional regulator n=1 Tax=Loktanella atrilutea TaxID=366533 RepID=A0A1M4UDT0_LOKAT|nr:LuxR family transcriptional regulator [Loktanella atrilutea]SHE55011.1 LuxR family transcriptional regulator [Loktanella atrilutea]